MNKELIDNKYWIKIERDGKSLININYVNVKKLEGNWQNLTYRINLKVSDKNHIFSFYGKNGIGKTTICKNINEEENIKHLKLNKEEIQSKKNVQIYRINEKLSFENFIFYGKKENVQYKCSFLHKYFKCKDISMIKRHNINCQIEEYKANQYIIDNIDRVFVFVKEYIQINKIHIGELTWHKYNCDCCLFSIFVKNLEEKLSEKKISISRFIRMIKNGTFEYNDSGDDLFKIFEQNELSHQIVNLLDNILFKFNRNIEICKDLTVRDNKIIEKFSDFKIEFELISKDMFDRIEIEEKFNSFLSCKYYEIFMINKKGIKIKLSDFIERLSEGQQKKIKLFFILSEISATCSNKSIIIADDIFDSFDNNNVIHLTSLMKKILDIKKPTVLFFSHDFEIFKIINKYMGVKKNDAYLIRRIDEWIKHEQCFVKDGTFEEYIMPEFEKSLTDEKLCMYFLASSACIREDIERLLGSDNDYYLKITSLLHIKKDSKDVINKLEYLFKLKYFNIFIKYKTLIENYAKTFESYFEILDSIYNKVIECQDIKELELNIFLAIYGRILIEKKIIEQLKLYGYEEDDILAPIKRNQTKYLIEYYKQKTSKNIPNSIEELNEYLTKFIHLSRGLSYIINIDSRILIELIYNVKIGNFE